MSWYEANRERARETARRYYQANREAILEKNRQWAKAHPDKMREYARRYNEANVEKERERQRRSGERNRQNRREQSRKYRANRGPEARRIQHWQLNHGLRPEDWAQIWSDQDGCCYLCGDALLPGHEHIDHDHRCCPKDKSCAYCRRGLACAKCNQCIGMADDDPERLHQIAGNLAAALADVAIRLSGKPQQLTLDAS